MRKGSMMFTVSTHGSRRNRQTKGMYATTVEMGPQIGNKQIKYMIPTKQRLLHQRVKATLLELSSNEEKGEKNLNTPSESEAEDTTTEMTKKLYRTMGKKWKGKRVKKHVKKEVGTP
ncbi:hypothetical protein CHS0354_032938 [Potamilus streckersoni]|uniref:Uncharacterized protein n=1 Tax=Potamilus streckersoni TaxID=2493646 RepID=A0AAE0VKF4_9BIVA|nr:hypothetical protein CHS0354_032938 [Potamilus streckersoni]